MLKTSGNGARFPNTQHKLRYAYQFLTGKAQRTMWIHLRKSTADRGECHGPVFLGIEVRICIVYYISCGVLLHWHLGSSLLMLLI